MRSFLLLSLLLCSASPAFAAITQNYSEVKLFLDRLAKQNPDNASIFTIGLSDNGELIQGLKVGNGSLKNLVVGTHHGNEYGSSEVALAFAESIAKTPIRGQTIFVIPVLNISGYNKRSRNENSHDPNRDYPGPCATEGPFLLKSTKALADFIDRENIVTSATLHTHFPAVVWPWGLSSHDLSTPYQSTFELLTKLATQDSHYQIGNSTEVIYPADGTYEDYAYWKHGIWSILFELGYSHYPNETDVKSMIDENVPGLRRMMENSPLARAEDHEFRGKCDMRLRALDRHDE